MSPYAKQGKYQTDLSPQDEANFQDWVRQNHIPFDPGPKSDYDMRGFYQSMQRGDPQAKTAVSGFDGMPHFPDTYKTPYHRTFSNESQYALPNAPHWDGDRLLSESGQVVADETPKSKSLSIVNSQPLEQPGLLSRAGTFVSDTLSKTAHNMDLTHTLDTVAHAGELAQQGRILSGGPDDKEESVMSTLKTLIPNPADIAKDVWGKMHAGDISGASAAILPLLLGIAGPKAAEAGAEAAPGAFSKVAETASKVANSDTATAVGGFAKGAVRQVVAPKSMGVHAATVAARAVPYLPEVIEAGNAVYGGIKGAKQALAAKRATAPAQTAYTDAAADNAASVAPAAATPEAPAAAPAPQALPSAGPSAEVLEGVSQWATKKPFAKLSAKDQISVRAIAAKLGNPQDTLGAIAGETVAPVVPEIKAAPAAAKPIDTGILSYPGHTKGFDMSEWTPEEARQFSPQEAQSRQSIAIKLAPALLKAGIKAEDLGTEAGRARAAEIASAIPSLSKNKALMNSLKNYDPSDLTLDAAQTLMSQWDKFSGMLGFKNLADIAKK